MPGERSERTRLPRNTPQPLRDFVRCRRDSVTIEPGTLDWLPTPPGLPDGTLRPSVAFSEEDGAAVITVTWGFLAVRLPATVENGRLRIDTSHLPGILDSLKREIEEWVDDLNADLRANGRQLGGWELEDGDLSLRKAPLAAAAGGEKSVSAAPPGPVIPVGAGTAAAGPKPRSAPEPRPAPRPDPGGGSWFDSTWKKVAWGVGIGIAVVGTGLTLLFWGGDDPAPPAASPLTTSTAAVTPAAGNGSPESPPAGDTRDDDTDDGTGDDGPDGDDAPGPGSSGAFPPCNDDWRDLDVEAEMLLANVADEPLAELWQTETAWVEADVQVDAADIWPGLDPVVHLPCTGYDLEGVAPAPPTEVFVDGLPTASRAPYPVCAGPGGCRELFAVGPARTAYDHAVGGRDFITGDQGLSRFWSVFPANSPGTYIVPFECSGIPVFSGVDATGAGPVVTEGPLFQFGPCTSSGDAAFSPGDGEDDLRVVLTGPEGGPLAFDVGPGEIPLETIDTGTFLDLSDPAVSPVVLGAMLDPAATITGHFVPPGVEDCAFQVRSRDDGSIRLVDPCGGLADFFALEALGPRFRAGDPATRVYAQGAGLTGIVDPVFADSLFDNTVFPCGPGRVALTACPTDGLAHPSLEMVLAALVLDTPLPTAPSDARYGFAFDADGDPGTGLDPDAGTEWAGTDRVYEVGGDGEAWVVTAYDPETGEAVPTGARAMIRNHTIVLAVEKDEAGIAAGAGYRTYAVAGGAQSITPAPGEELFTIASSPLPVYDPATVRTALAELLAGSAGGGTDDGGAGDEPGGETTETVESFAGAFAVALAEGDLDFLFDRLHPAVIANFGEDTCRAYIETTFLAVSDYRITGAVQGPRVENVPLGSRSIRVEEFFEAPVAFEFQGETIEATGTFAREGDQIRWFTTCEG